MSCGLLPARVAHVGNWSRPRSEDGCPWPLRSGLPEWRLHLWDKPPAPARFNFREQHLGFTSCSLDLHTEGLSLQDPRSCLMFIKLSAPSCCVVACIYQSACPSHLTHLVIDRTVSPPLPHVKASPQVPQKTGPLRRKLGVSKGMRVSPNPCDYVYIYPCSHMGKQEAPGSRPAKPRPAAFGGAWTSNGKISLFSISLSLPLSFTVTPGLPAPW